MWPALQNIEVDISSVGILPIRPLWTFKETVLNLKSDGVVTTTLDSTLSMVQTLSVNKPNETKRIMATPDVRHVVKMFVMKKNEVRAVDRKPEI